MIPNRFIKRINREIAKVTQDELEGIIFEPIDENNPSDIYGFMIGQPGTPYEGGCFKFCIKVSQDYPFIPPKFYFKTKILVE